MQFLHILFVPIKYVSFESQFHESESGISFHGALHSENPSLRTTCQEIESLAVARSNKVQGNRIENISSLVFFPDSRAPSELRASKLVVRTLKFSSNWFLIKHTFTSKHQSLIVSVSTDEKFNIFFVFERLF